MLHMIISAFYRSTAGSKKRKNILKREILNRPNATSNNNTRLFEASCNSKELCHAFHQFSPTIGKLIFFRSYFVFILFHGDVIFEMTFKICLGQPFPLVSIPLN